MIKPLIITSIGQPKVGKTTVLSFIGEILLENNLPIKVIDFNQDSCAELTNLMSPRYRLHTVRDTVTLFPAPNYIVLVDGITDKEHVNLVKQFPSILIRVRRKNQKDEHWTEDIVADLFIYNDDSFRLLKFQLWDLFTSEIMNTKQWKQCVSNL